MSPVPQLELDRQLCFALYDATRAVVRAYGPLLAELGLTYPQYVTMLVLWESDGPCSVGALGARLHLDSGTLTPLLKRLEHLGLVERQRDHADERRVLVSLTAKGEGLQAAALDIPACLLERTGLDVKGARALRDQLATLVATLDRAAPA